MKEFNNIEEMKKYYDKEKNLFYIEDDIIINFDLVCEWNIEACDIYTKNIVVKNINAYNIYAFDIIAESIYAWNINAKNIIALDIDAWNINVENITALDINAEDIDANNIGAIDINACNMLYRTLICKSIQSERINCKHAV